MDPETTTTFLEFVRELKAPASVILGAGLIYFLWPRFAGGLAAIITAFKGKGKP